MVKLCAKIIICVIEFIKAFVELLIRFVCASDPQHLYQNMTGRVLGWSYPQIIFLSLLFELVYLEVRNVITPIM